ncbi:MAG: hypothetical protein EPO61_15315 [Nitrospirae bacterium]|nr:MAG: hypothetical protein EPO61_15315 [Nitrospirota bacterium]
MPRRLRSPSGAILACALWGIAACSTGPMSGPHAERLRTPEGLAEWNQQELSLRGEVRATADQYGRAKSLDALQSYEKSVRAFLDHGFALYRAYRAARLDPPPDLIPSLEQRTAWLMDVAEEYIKLGSVAMGEGIAADVVHDYSDLPVLAPAQRRAEAVLMRYRYRQDY